MNKREKYEDLLKKAQSLLVGQMDEISAMASLSSLIKEIFPDLLWVGFYRKSKDGLIVGPYQGPVACLKIPFEKGVCGDCFSQKKTILVPDVHKYDGHITCDSRSNSEIVIPVFNQKNEIVAVLDIDSLEFEHFDSLDAAYLEKLMKFLVDRKIFD